MVYETQGNRIIAVMFRPPQRRQEKQSSLTQPHSILRVTSVCDDEVSPSPGMMNQDSELLTYVTDDSGCSFEKAHQTTVQISPSLCTKRKSRSSTKSAPSSPSKVVLRQRGKPSKPPTLGRSSLSYGLKVNNNFLHSTPSAKRTLSLKSSVLSEGRISESFASSYPESSPLSQTKKSSSFTLGCSKKLWPYSYGTDESVLSFSVPWEKESKQQRVRRLVTERSCANKPWKIRPVSKAALNSTNLSPVQRLFLAQRSVRAKPLRKLNTCVFSKVMSRCLKENQVDISEPDLPSELCGLRKVNCPLSVRPLVTLLPSCPLQAACKLETSSHHMNAVNFASAPAESPPSNRRDVNSLHHTTSSSPSSSPDHLFPIGRKPAADVELGKTPAASLDSPAEEIDYEKSVPGTDCSPVVEHQVKPTTLALPAFPHCSKQEGFSSSEPSECSDSQHPGKARRKRTCDDLIERYETESQCDFNSTAVSVSAVQAFDFSGSRQMSLSFGENTSTETATAFIYGSKTSQGSTGASTAFIFGANSSPGFPTATCPSSPCVPEMDLSGQPSPGVTWSSPATSTTSVSPAVMPSAFGGCPGNNAFSISSKWCMGAATPRTHDAKKTSRGKFHKVPHRRLRPIHR